MADPKKLLELIKEISKVVGCKSINESQQCVYILNEVKVIHLQ